MSGNELNDITLQTTKRRRKKSRNQQKPNFVPADMYLEDALDELELEFEGEDELLSRKKGQRPKPGIDPVKYHRTRKTGKKRRPSQDDFE